MVVDCSVRGSIAAEGVGPSKVVVGKDMAAGIDGESEGHLYG